MRTPSPRLKELLKQLNLCTAADFRACQSRVKRLVRDLPAFDSVWIDALVQLRRLTPFQGEVLLSSEPERLNAGPCVLIDKLGNHSSGQTFLACQRGTENKCVVKYVDPSPEQFDRVTENLDRLALAFQRFSHPSIAGPHASLEHNGRLVTVSRHVRGASIRDTLIQTGRFQPNDVIEIGRQVLNGLAAMEPHWEAHGDIRIANMRLAADGSACLANCGIAVAAERRFIVHHKLRPDRCDTVAPELIGTDRTADAQSDLYALGCLFWQLLCGRPPFPCADPLEKLAAHQSGCIPDVREVAPETPAWMADAITNLTRPERTERPASFADSARRWNKHTTTRGPGPNALNRFSPRIREMARRSSPPRTASKWVLAATLLTCLSGAGLVLQGQAGRLSLLDSAKAKEPEVVRTTAVDLTSPTPRATRALPQPDANGVISLPDVGPWGASRIESPGPISIQGPDGLPAIIEVDIPFVVVADSFALDNVTLSGDSIGCLIDCTARTVRMRRTTFHGRKTPVGLKWTAPDERDRSGRSITMTDSVVQGVRAAIELNTPAADINLGNVLVTDGRSIVRMSVAGRPGQNTTFRLVRVTARRMAHVIESVLPAERTTPARSDVWLGDSVFALEGRNAAVFALIGPALPGPAGPMFETSSRPDADASLMSLQSKLAVWVNPLTGRLGEVPDDLVVGDDLTPSPLRFRSEALAPSSSELTDFEAPRSSTRMPGVTAGSLPGT